jgi:Sec-independent protein secretion pathway component TatC
MQLFWKNLRYVVLIVSIVVAVVTPTPDAVAMLIFMAPMVMLFLLFMAFKS